MKKNVSTNAFVVIISIGVFGLVAAYVCFGILNSSADGKFKEYSVGGAIAGAVISWITLTTLYLKLRKPEEEMKELEKEGIFKSVLKEKDGEIENLRIRNEELQQKLIRGANHPSNYKIEVSELQKFVLARPEDWEPRGGVLLDLRIRRMAEPKMYSPHASRSPISLRRITNQKLICFIEGSSPTQPPLMLQMSIPLNIFLSEESLWD